jgi:hypothetical protein
MFDPKKWMRESHRADDVHTITISGEEIKIRALKGSEWEKFSKTSNSPDSSGVATVLSAGLVKPFGSYSYDDMVKFYDACPIVADKIAGKIIELTIERLSKEQEVLEEQEKNSEMTDIPSPSDDGVENTVKTP